MTDIPKKSNGGKGKYEVVSEAEFNSRVGGGSRFNGFIVYPNKQYGFAVPMQGNDTIWIGRNQGIVMPKQNHFVFKPMGEKSGLDRLRAMIKDQTPLERNPKDYAHQRNKKHSFTGISGVIPNTATINTIFNVSGDKEKFDKNFKNLMTGRYVATDSITGLSSINGYVSDSETAIKANETNQWVNKFGVFYADDVASISDADFTNYLLGCMIYGIGYENIYFPTDGTVSNKLKDAGIVKDALTEFYKINKGKTGNLTSLSEEFSGDGHSLPSLVFNGRFHPETFLGSANVRIKQKNSKQLIVEVFNITSLTSGDFFKHPENLLKHVLGKNPYPISVVREQLYQECENLKYGNISQTYSFTVDIDFSKLNDGNGGGRGW